MTIEFDYLIKTVTLKNLLILAPAKYLNQKIFDFILTNNLCSETKNNLYKKSFTKFCIVYMDV